VRGILLVDKPEGETSFSSLGPLKRALGTRKIGHTGTLDRFASGLMIVLVGQYARLSQWFSGLDKTYRARIAFGKETDTLDPEGRIVAEGPLPSEDALREALPRFVGELAQRPPEFSAVHIQGRRAYQRKLSGEDFELPLRNITIRSIDFLGYRDGDLDLRVSCSKGTYIRSLARDIAASLGSRAHVKTLRRERVGPFCVEGALPPTSIDATSPRELLPAEASALGLKPSSLTDAGIDAVIKGRPLFPECFASTPIRGKELALYWGSKLVAVASLGNRGTSYACVLDDA
jgi:tRNA pseudouridine55 synthase